MSRQNDLWDTVYDLATDYIKRKRRENEMRDGYYELMSENRWKNRDFNDLVDSIVEVERVIEDRYHRDGRKGIDALEDAIADIVDGHFAQVVLADRDLADRLPDRTYDSMRDASDLLDEIMKSDRGRGRGRGRDSHDDRYDDRDRRDRRDRGRDYGGRGSDDRRERSFGDRRDEREDRSRRDDRRSGSSGSAGDAWSHLIDDEPREEERRQERNEPEEREPRREETPPPRQAPEPRAARRSNVNGPDFTKADPFGDFWQDDEHWVVSHRSSWELFDTETEEYDTPTWHDLNKFVKYYVKATNGSVREEFVPVTEENAYINQEVGLARGEVAERKTGGGISLKASRRDVGEDILHDNDVAPPAPAVSLAECLDEITAIVPNLSESNAVDSMPSAIFAARCHMYAEERNVGLKLSHKRTPVNLSSWDQLDLIDQIAEAPSLVAAAAMMNELRPQFDIALWNLLNERFTETTLRVMRYQFQFGVKAMNFARDFAGPVMDKMVKDLGDEVASRFGDRSRYVIRAVCTYASREDLADVVGDLFGGAVKHPTAVFMDFMEIISMNHTCEQLGISNIFTADDKNLGFSVTSARQRSLQAAFAQMYNKLMGSLPPSAFARVMLSTSDNLLVEVTPFSNRTEAFILNAVK